MSNVPTVFARSVRKIADTVALRGNARHLLGSVGLDREAIEDPALRIPYSDMMMLSVYAARMTKDADFGLHVGERVQQHEYGAVGYSVITSSTLGEALRSLVRYLPIWTNVGVFKLDVEGSVAHFQWEYSESSIPEPRHDCEMSMASVMQFNRFRAGAEWTPREVWFQHAKPKDTSEHARIFRAPVRFGMPTNALLLDSRLLDTPLRTARPHLHRAITESAEQFLAMASGEASFSQSVLSFVRQRLNGGDFDLDSAARHFHLSRRTLQRKLRLADVSLRSLVQQARRDLSQHLLVDAGMTATETAYALGYSEPSVFHRAFQKWHGMPPGAFGRE
ncbi:MAG TPA: AraC family transcriptional regulator [Terriglobales bacterium]|nr:AraC family transcriptional regulator [Terriglobales bacterium]